MKSLRFTLFFMAAFASVSSCMFHPLVSQLIGLNERSQTANDDSSNLLLAALLLNTNATGNSGKKGIWVQDAYLKASNAGDGDRFGYSVSINGDFAVVGAYFEDNASTTIDNTDNATITDTGTVTDSGAAYIFKKDASGNWVQDAYLKPGNAGAADYFGESVSISGDYVIIGSYLEDNASTTINNTDNVTITDTGTATNSGAAYIFKKDALGNWVQDAYLKASNAGATDFFAPAVYIAGDYAIVSAIQEDNSSITINNTDDAIITDAGTSSDSGAVYIFKKDASGNWVQDAYLKPSNTGAGDNFGSNFSLNGDYLIVGSFFEDNASTTINKTDNATITDIGTAVDAGAAYIFKKDASGNWVQDAYLKAGNAEAGDRMGVDVSISGDYAIVGAYFEDNASTTIDNTDNATITDTGTALDSGAVYVFKKDASGNWVQDAYLKPGNTGAGNYFGESVIIDGNYIVVGARYEDNASTTIDNTDNVAITDTGAAADSGAAYIFKKDASGNWVQDAYLKPGNTGLQDEFGVDVSMSGDYVIVGSYFEDNASTTIDNTDNGSITDTGTAFDSGAAYIFKLE